MTSTASVEILALVIYWRQLCFLLVAHTSFARWRNRTGPPIHTGSNPRMKAPAGPKSARDNRDLCLAFAPVLADPLHGSTMIGWEVAHTQLEAEICWFPAGLPPTATIASDRAEGLPAPGPERGTAPLAEPRRITDPTCTIATIVRPDEILLRRSRFHPGFGN